MRNLNEIGFNELVNRAMMDIHLALLKEGGNGMRSAIYNLKEKENEIKL